MPSLHQLATIVSPWAELYSRSSGIQAFMMFGHLGSMMLGGGAAVHADRATLRLPQGEERSLHLLDLRHTHPVVVAALAVMAATGVAMLLADLESLAVSPVFWVKMGLVGVLLVNGIGMLRIEQRLVTPDNRAARDWTRLLWASRASLGLWFSLVLLGALLPILA
jgi:hypothetical protein